MAQDPSRGGSPPESAEIRALAELTLCESLAQTSGWAARWSAELSGADAALLWAPDALQPAFLCIAAHGAGTERALRRSASRESGIVHDLVRDRTVVLLRAEQLAEADDPFLKVLPSTTAACLLVPLQAERLVTGLLALTFHQLPDRNVLQNLQGFLKHATPALARALRAERKTSGMLHAIERLTSLYDLTKAFASTIDLAELSTIIAGKAADFTGAEVASLWTLDAVAGEVALAATAVNEAYGVTAPEGGVGAPLVGDLLANREIVRRNELPPDDPLSGDGSVPVRSILAVPLLEDEVPVGALVVANKRGRRPEFTAADEELLVDLERQAVRALHHVRQYEAEKKVAELDALLAVSREITSTLDLDKVMRTIVNATSALIRYDRCAIAILQRGKLRVGAVSGAAEVDRKDPSVLRTEALLEDEVPVGALVVANKRGRRPEFTAAD
ncbi:MAG TPA: GAF domain-containing protein, partial [Thermoanaerobaculia bacterium]|nr:GAF domain-containing protein [Thermoanaerobaculia bacterium]